MCPSRKVNRNRRSATPPGKVTFEMVHRHIVVVVDTLGLHELHGVGELAAGARQPVADLALAAVGVV
jgi:hypothetical protein